MVPPLTASLVVETLLAAVRTVHWSAFAPRDMSPLDTPLVRGCEAAAAAASSSQAALESVIRLAAEAASRECPPVPAWCAPEAARLSERVQVALLVAAWLLGLFVGVGLTLAVRRANRAPAPAPPIVWGGFESPTPRSSSSLSEGSRRRARVPDIAGDPAVLARFGLPPTRSAGALTPKTRHGGARLA